METQIGLEPVHNSGISGNGVPLLSCLCVCPLPCFNWAFNGSISVGFTSRIAHFRWIEIAQDNTKVFRLLRIGVVSVVVSIVGELALLRHCGNGILVYCSCRRGFPRLTWVQPLILWTAIDRSEPNALTSRQYTPTPRGYQIHCMSCSRQLPISNAHLLIATHEATTASQTQRVTSDGYLSLVWPEEPRTSPGPAPGQSQAVSQTQMYFREPRRRFTGDLDPIVWLMAAGAADRGWSRN